MTTTTPLHGADREVNYYRQMRWGPLTPRQTRRVRHKANRRLNR